MPADPNVYKHVLRDTCHISGGGILNSLGTMRLYSSTVSGNTCDLGAGVTASDTTFLKNTIVANNTSAATGGDCSGNVTSQGYNIIGDRTGCTVGGTTTGNIYSTDPSGPVQSPAADTHARLLRARDHAGAPVFFRTPQAALPATRR